MTTIDKRRELQIAKLLLARRRSEKSLVEFVKQAWHVIEPETEYKHGWHIEAICEHLQAVSEGKIKKLLINVSPRFMKSTIVSVMWPAWEWIRSPGLKWLCASYAASLSVRDSVKCRRLIESEWYKLFFGDCYKLTSDQNQKSRFENDKSGYRVATSVGGGGTGEGGERILCLPGYQIIKCTTGDFYISQIVNKKMFVDVLSYNHITNKIEPKKIIKHFKNENKKKLIEITTSSNAKITCTTRHPIFCCNFGEYKPARDLRVLDTVFNLNLEKPEIITKIRISKYEAYVYNIEVEDNNNYFANNILVHNCDDPHKVMESESDVMRQAAIDWWFHEMSTRANSAEKSAFVVIGQRVHENDLSGAIIENGGYDHLCIPMRFDEDRRCKTSIGWVDPRLKEGDLAWPNRFNEADVQTIEKNLARGLGSYHVAGQLQQNPSAKEGGILKLAWFRYYKSLPDCDEYLQSWDLAFEDKKTSAFVVGQVWGRKGGDYYFIDQFRDKVSFTKTLSAIRSLTDQYPLATAKVIERKANGSAVIDTLKKEISGIIPWEPKGSKEERAHVVSPVIESGNVYLPEGAMWLPEFLEECRQFPKSKYKDQVDTMVQALLRFIQTKKLVQRFSMPTDLSRPSTWLS